MTSPRDKVVDATLALAASRDFSEATLSDIAHHAGISLADLRDLFPSKGAIIGGFTRRIDRQVLDALAGINLTEPARDRLQTVLTKRLEALEPYRDAIASIVTWAKADPLILSALNREIVNSMRYMLEAADMESDGPVGALKLQGLALAWSRVIDAWLAGDHFDGVNAIEKELARGERYVGHAEELERLTRPARDMFTKLIGLAGGERSRHTTSDDDYPHPHA